MRCLGVDLHSNSLYLKEMKIAEGGEISVSSHHFKLQGDSFQKFQNYLQPDDYILVEASTNAFWFHDQVSSKIKACYVYNTNQARREGNKTDKIDAEHLMKKLAFYLLMNGAEKDMPTVYVPPPEARALRGMLTTYNLYNGIITKIKNRIHSIYKGYGICLDRKGFEKKDALSKLMQIEIPSAWKEQVQILYNDISMNLKSREQIKDKIIELGSKLFKEEVEILLSIIGFSPFTAITFMSDVVEIGRFKNVKKLCAYLRTAPKIKESNKKTQIGNVNRASRSTTVSLLTQSVIHFTRAGKHMSNFYNRVKKGKSIGKARLALIRKIIVSAYYMLKRKKKYYWVDELLYQRKLKEYHKLLDKINRKDEKIKEIA